jgi:hypothetical protein
VVEEREYRALIPGRSLRRAFRHRSAGSRD